MKSLLRTHRKPAAPHTLLSILATTESPQVPAPLVARLLPQKGIDRYWSITNRAEGKTNDIKPEILLILPFLNCHMCLPFTYKTCLISQIFSDLSLILPPPPKKHMLPIPWCDLKICYQRTEKERNQARKSNSLSEEKRITLKINT